MPDTPTLPAIVAARCDPALHAQLRRRVPMRYAAGADPAHDRPAHVRAGSGVACVGDRLVVIQDDAAFLALVDPRTGLADAVPLPADEHGHRQWGTARGNKHRKLDLEACVALPPSDGAVRLLAFGSGSTARREQVLVATFPDGAADAARTHVSLVHAPALYAALRAEPTFAGSELNVEGAVLLAGRIRLFGRGNGAARDGRAPASATCDVDVETLLAHLLADGPPPTPSGIVAYALGAIEGVPLGFTDAALWPLPDPTAPRILYAAAAERSPNTVDDGEVVGSAIGLLDADGTARWTPLLDESGAPFRGKIEGLLPMADDPWRLWVVTDGDDPDTPSELGEVGWSG